MKSLPLFHRIDGTRVVVVGNGAPGEARRRLVERAGGRVCGEAEAHHAALAFVALEDRDEAAASALRLKRRGLLVNVADRPELCDFTVPSLLDRDPVLIAVGTSGASAGLAKQLRLALERLLPQSLGRLAEALHELRPRLRDRFPEAGERRRALDAALGPGGPLDPLAEHPDGAVRAWLEEADAPAPRTVTIWLRGDDPEDLTLREARLLGEADAIYHEATVGEAVLARARADAQRHPLEEGSPAPGDRAPAGGLTLILRRSEPN